MPPAPRPRRERRVIPDARPAPPPVPAPAGPGPPRLALTAGLPPRTAELLGLALVLLAVALVHVAALRTFFAQDDITFLARARGLEPTPWSLARLLSGALRWRLMNALFGLNPLPYHLLNFALHLANVALVYLLGRRLLGGRAAAAAAAVLFGASSIAFTPLHWATGMGELMATLFALLSLELYLAARERGSTPWSWLSAAALLAALLSKETVLLLPAVLLLAGRRAAGPGARRGMLIPAAGVAIVWAVAFLATIRWVDYSGGEAYAMTAAPGFLAQNLATYLRWCVTLQNPVRDAVAAMDPRAWPIGLAVALAVGALLWTRRREARHPEEVGAAWFFLMLLPVLPLRHHTYLYYLYPAWPGLCWLLAGAGQRLARRLPAALPVALGALLAFVLVEAWSVRARERAMTGDFPADRTVRESQMLRNVVAALDSLRLAPGTRIALVNPAPRRHSALVAGADGSFSYIPLEVALRRGEAVRLFFPRLEYLGFYLGFGASVPQAWQDAELLLYQDDGQLTALGRRSQGLARLGYYVLRLRQWSAADSLFRRSLALGDTVADATFGLVVTSSFLGRPEEARAHAAEFLRRWPRDPRAAVVLHGLREETAR